VIAIRMVPVGAEPVGDACPRFSPDLYSASNLPTHRRHWDRGHGDRRQGDRRSRNHQPNGACAWGAPIPPEQQSVVFPVPVRTWIIPIYGVQNLMSDNGRVPRIVGIDSEDAYGKTVACGDIAYKRRGSFVKLSCVRIRRVANVRVFDTDAIRI